MRIPSRLLAWVTAALALAGPLASAGAQQGKDPKPPSDIPPIGKGKILLYEDFETTATGQVPRGYQKTGSVGVVEDVSHSGLRALRIEPAPNGPRRITFKDNDVLAALGGQHWGRLYFRVQLPTPAPQGGVIHSTLVAGSAQSPLAKDPIEVRVADTVLGSEGTHQYLYNVQPSKRPEFGKGSSYKFKYTDRWTLAEWFVDHATQTYRLFIDGEEVKEVAFTKGPGRFADAEIPELFESLSFGWNNYQSAGTGFVAWIDDIALAKDRLGARNVPPPAKRSARKR